MEFNNTIKNFDEYKKYLKSSEWKEKREQVIYQFGKKPVKCGICYTRTATQAHHLSYKYIGEPEEINDLIPVCRFCHNLIHRKDIDINISDMEMSWIKSTIKNIDKEPLNSPHRAELYLYNNPDVEIGITKHGHYKAIYPKIKGDE